MKKRIAVILIAFYLFLLLTTPFNKKVEKYRAFVDLAK